MTFSKSIDDVHFEIKSDNLSTISSSKSISKPKDSDLDIKSN